MSILGFQKSIGQRKPPAHKARAHSKFSASGAERWFNCPGSVEISEGLPDKSSPWAVEGTRAHEVLEAILLGKDVDAPRAMKSYGNEAADFLRKLAQKTDSELLVESKVYLDFIHPEAFGTLDNAVPEYFGTLHVLDYKYGQGHVVSPKGNLQMLFYAIALAHKFDWNFSRARLWIIQPRAKGYNGPVFWEITIHELQKWVFKFEDAIDRVVKFKPEYHEGPWCWWCRAKGICPLKMANKEQEAQRVFGTYK